MTRQQAGVSAVPYGKPTLTFGDGEYSCASCGLGMREPCQHWRGFLEAAATAPPEQAADREVTVALEQVTNALEECAVLLCEVHMRFGEPKIMDDDFQKEGEFTFKQAGQMYEEQAKRARGILAEAKRPDQPQPVSAGALSALIEKWRERAKDAQRDSELDEEFEVGNSAKAAWVGTCADELEDVLAGHDQYKFQAKRLKEILNSYLPKGKINWQILAQLLNVELSLYSRQQTYMSSTRNMSKSLLAAHDQKVRAETLEEAAKVADQYPTYRRDDQSKGSAAADAIRSLAAPALAPAASKPEAHKETEDA